MPDRHVEMLTRYGFGLFPVPRYPEFEGGPWSVRRHRPGIGDGYVTGPVIEGAKTVLYQGRIPWMSTGLMERESHAWHVHAANGLVVAAGFGLGMFAFAAAAKPDVERVVVIERDPSLIDSLTGAGLFRSGGPWDKVEVLVADALAPDTPRIVAARTNGRAADYFYADIWPVCPDPAARDEAARMAQAFRPRAAGWWGQEVGLAKWSRATGSDIDETAPIRYFAEDGLPQPTFTPGYAVFCRDVATLNPDRPAKSKSWVSRLFRS